MGYFRNFLLSVNDSIDLYSSTIYHKYIVELYIRGGFMNRDKNLPLTETFSYVLLTLIEPAHGYAIMQKVEELSNGQVRLAAGTMYGAIEILLKKKWISYLPRDDSRRKVYVISALGKKVLSSDYSRMLHMIDVSKKLML